MSETRRNLTRKLKSTRATLVESTTQYPSADGSGSTRDHTSYSLEPARMTLDLSDPVIGARHNGPMTQGWGGATLFQLTVRGRNSRGRYCRVHVWVSARISGDSRAGSQDGIHVSVAVGNRGKDVRKELHVNPARGFPEDE